MNATRKAHVTQLCTTTVKACNGATIEHSGIDFDGDVFPVFTTTGKKGLFIYSNKLDGDVIDLDFTDTELPPALRSTPQQCQQQQANAGANFKQVGADIVHAQTMLNTHPEASPYWDSHDGQDVLESAQRYNLRATNTNRERCAIHASAMQAARATLRPEVLVEAFQQIARLSLEADRSAVDVASMLGDIARDAIIKAAQA